MLRCLLTSALVLLAFTARADDPARERKAKVALALAGGAPKAASIAPAPRPAALTYSAGYKAATSTQKPLVVYVNCRATPVSGAVVTAMDTFGEVTGPAVVVGYPVGDKVLVEVTLAGEPDAATVAIAVKKAASKIDAPMVAKDLPAPKPLSWDL